MERLAASLARLFAVTPDDDHALACQFAPELWLDVHEPFRPLAAGYTIFRRNGRSPSFPRTIQFTAQTTCVIEYAIWWDWDIHHLYELEHLWIYLDRAGEIVRTEGSWHGKVKRLQSHSRSSVPLLVSPGKHAFATDPAEFQTQHRRTPGLTGRYAGSGGIGGGGLFPGEFRRTPPGDRLIATYLKQHAFPPSWQFNREFKFRPPMLVPWPALRAWIPGRVRLWQVILPDLIQPGKVCPFRTAVCPTPADITTAGSFDLEMAQIPVHGRIDTFRALAACRKARLGAYLLPLTGRAKSALAWVLKRGDWSDYVMTGSRRPAETAQLKAALPGYRAALILPGVRPDALVLAQSCAADYVHFLQADGLTAGLVTQIHQAGLGMIVGPELGKTAVARLRTCGIDGIVQEMVNGES